jgi:hypothetical protein
MLKKDQEEKEREEQRQRDEEEARILRERIQQEQREKL